MIAALEAVDLLADYLYSATANIMTKVMGDRRAASVPQAILVWEKFPGFRVRGDSSMRAHGSLQEAYCFVDRPSAYPSSLKYSLHRSKAVKMSPNMWT